MSVTAQINAILAKDFIVNSELDTINFANWGNIGDNTQIKKLISDFSGNNLKQSIVYLSLKLVAAAPTKKDIITQKLYDVLESNNQSITNAQITNLAKTHIFDNSKNILINNGTIIPTDYDKTIYKALRTISLRKNREEFTTNALRQSIKDVSANDNDANIDAFITSVNADLSLNLIGFDLSGVNLTNADLSGSDLTNADLSGANLTNSILNGVDVSGTNLTNTNIKDASITGLKNVNNTTGIATNLPYTIKTFKNGMRELTQELVNGSVSSQETTIGPFTQGQTIVVNGVQIILGASGTDATLVDANPDSDGDSFAFIEKNNNIKVWGHKNKGGNVSSDISNVKLISSTNYSKAVLTNNGSVYAWGNSQYGGTVPTDVSGVIDLFANEKAFCALQFNGKVVCWGDVNTGGTTPTDISNVIQVYSNKNAFTALMSNGKVHSWGTVSGSAPSTDNFVDIFSTNDCFIGLKGDGSISSWGSSTNSLNTPPTDLSNVSIVYTNENACVALTGYGYLYNWGDANYGGTTNLTGLSNIEHVYNNNHAFAVSI